MGARLHSTGSVAPFTSSPVNRAPGESSMTENRPSKPQSGRQNLDPHLERSAARTAGMPASEPRALSAGASRPEVVSLAGGMPNLSPLPLDTLSAQVADIIAEDG